MMKINSKKTIVLVLSLSVLQVIIISPMVLAEDTVNGDLNGSLREHRNVQLEQRTTTNIENRENRQEKMQDIRVNIQDRQDKMEANKADRLAASCERIGSMKESQSKRFSEKQAVFKQNFGEKMPVFENNRESNDAKLNDAHEKQDEQRNSMYMKLEEVAKTDAQKEAVKEFQKTVEQAVIDRRSAVSDALDTFRSDVDALVKSKKTSVTGAIDMFQTSVKTAFEKAQSDCVSGTDPKTVRDTLATSIKDARTKLQVSRQSFEGIGDSVSALAVTKKTTLDKAMQDFKTTMEKARADLKSVLKQ